MKRVGSSSAALMRTILSSVRVLGALCVFAIPQGVVAQSAAGESRAAAPATNQAVVSDKLTIVAPSIAGGGWDLTAQAMKATLEAEGLYRSVEVVRSPGAGGLIGLAQFSASRRGDGHALLVGGLFMLGAAVRNGAQVSVLDATPIARLTQDHEVVAVPAESPYDDLGDLFEAMQLDPGAMRWVGGSVGGPDQLVIWQLAHAAGVDPASMHYESIAGGSGVAAELSRHRFVAGVSGYSEMESAIKNGTIRPLAASQRVPGIDMPTFEELGITGIAFSNWRGVFAPPGISAEDRARLEGIVKRMVDSARWQAMLVQYHWEPAYAPGEEFAQFIRSEEQRISKSDPFAGGALDAKLLPSAKFRRFAWAIGLLCGVLVLLAVVYRQRLLSRRREGGLRLELQRVSEDVERRTREIEERTKGAESKLAGMSVQIEKEFDRWQLTSAERAIAHLMLKGLRLKDIARARNTSDRTVRQQAQAIYRKAGIDGRSDLAAYFLEDFLAPPEFNNGAPSASSASSPAAQPGVPEPRK